MIRDPRTGVILVIAAAPLMLSPLGLAILIFVAWQLPLLPYFRPISTQRKIAWERFQRSSLAFVVAAVVINGTFGGGERLFQSPVGHLSIDGLEFGLQTSLRLVVVTTSAILYILPLSSFELADRLRSWRLPVGIPVALLLALQVLEHLSEDIRRIQDAQTARGIVIRGSFLPTVRGLRILLAPLVFRSLTSSIDRAVGFQLRRLHLRKIPNAPGKENLPSNTRIGSLAMSVLVWSTFLYGILAWMGIAPYMI